MTSSSSRGFIALMAVIVIGITLLGLAAQASLAGWYARFNVLLSEQKEQASALAEGCADQALARLLANPSRVSRDPIELTTEDGVCIVEVDTDSTPGLVLVKSRGEVGEAVVNLELALAMGNILLPGTTATTGTLVVLMAVDGGGATVDAFSVSVPSATPSSFSGTSRRAVSITGPYEVNVTGPAGYTAVFSGECDASGGGTLSVGEAHSCVITMVRTPTTITAQVHVLNEKGGALQPHEVPLTLSGSSLQEGYAQVVSAGTYALALTLPPSYEVERFSGDCTSTGALTVREGESAICEITVVETTAGTLCENTISVAPTTSTGANSWNDPLAVLQSGGTVAYADASASGEYFGFALPALPLGATLRTLMVEADARSDTQHVCALTASISSDAGTSWSSLQQRSLTTGFSTIVFGGPTTPWDVALSGADISDGFSVRVRLGVQCPNLSRTEVDALRVKAAYGDPSCTVTSTTGTTEPSLLVETRVINDNGGSALPASFTVTVEGESFPGEAFPGRRVALMPGSYAVEGSSDTRYRLLKSPACTSEDAGVVRQHETRHCVLTYDDIPSTFEGASGIILNSWREVPKW